VDARAQHLRDQEQIEKDLDDDGGAEAPPAVAASNLGDLRCLGDHRLLCGNTDSSVSARSTHPASCSSALPLGSAHRANRNAAASSRPLAHT
jgi:hypothetical protein